jgi:hypothetical protein
MENMKHYHRRRGCFLFFSTLAPEGRRTGGLDEREAIFDLLFNWSFKLLSLRNCLCTSPALWTGVSPALTNLVDDFAVE